MRIGFFGGGPQAFAGLKAIIARPGWTVVFVHPRFENDPIISEFAKPRGVPILPFPRPTTPEAVDYLLTQSLDLIVSINCKHILAPSVLATSRLGGINLHNGLLPRQRGGGGAYVAIINGEPCGVTVHIMDAGVDTGAILVQREVALPPTATMGAFQEAFIAITPELICEAIEQLCKGFAGWPQDDRPFFYVPSKAPWDELIDWTLTSLAIFDRVRARTPGPTNFYLAEGVVHHVVDVALEPRVPTYVNTVGQVIQRDPQLGVLVKTCDTAIWLRRIRRAGETLEIVPRHPLGAILCQNVHLELYELKQRVARLERQLAKLVG